MAKKTDSLLQNLQVHVGKRGFSSGKHEIKEKVWATLGTVYLGILDERRICASTIQKNAGMA